MSFFSSTSSWFSDIWAPLLYWLIVGLLAFVPVMLGYSAWWLLLSFPAAVALVMLAGFIWVCFKHGPL